MMLAGTCGVFLIALITAEKVVWKTMDVSANTWKIFFSIENRKKKKKKKKGGSPRLVVFHLAQGGKNKVKGSEMNLPLATSQKWARRRSEGSWILEGSASFEVSWPLDSCWNEWPQTTRWKQSWAAHSTDPLLRCHSSKGKTPPGGKATLAWAGWWSKRARATWLEGSPSSRARFSRDEFHASPTVSVLLSNSDSRPYPVQRLPLLQQIICLSQAWQS